MTVEGRDDPVAIASRLGQVIARSAPFQALRAAEKAVEGDTEARTVRDQLEEQARHIATLEAQLRPVEVADKRRLGELRERAHRNALLQELARAQADYMDLMRRINDALHEALGESGA